MTLLERLTLIPLWKMRIFLMGATLVKPTHSSRKTFSCQAMENISLNALNIVELLYIGRIYKGEFSMEGKYKGRNERWF